MEKKKKGEGLGEAFKKSKRQSPSEHKTREMLQERINRIIKLKLEGSSLDEIRNELIVKYKLNSLSANLVIQDAFDEIRETAKEKSQAVLINHTNWYEALYKKFMEIGFQRGAMKALDQKEKLHDLHKDQFEIEINNTFKTVELDEFYDTSLLSQEDKNRLETIVKKIYL